MEQTPEQLAAEISHLAPRLALRSDLAETAAPRQVLYDLTSALSSLAGPLGTLVVHAGEYPDDTTGDELAAPGASLQATVRAVHHLLSKL